MYPSGKQVIKAFIANDFQFIDVNGQVITDLSDASIKVVDRVRITWRIQNNCQNNQKVTLPCDKTNPTICPILAALRLVLRARCLSQPDSMPVAHIYWSSKLQTETATSTMEAEIIALGSCCRELLPIIALVDKMGIAVGIKKPDDDDPSSSTMHITIHEDNSGALILATTPPPQFTPRSKHYVIKTNWWCEKIIEKKINVTLIIMRLQKGDIFTKMPSQVIFKFLWNLLHGW